MEEEQQKLTFNIVVPLYKKPDIVDKFSIKRLFDVIDTKYDVYFIFDTNYKYFDERYTKRGKMLVLTYS